LTPDERKLLHDVHGGWQKSIIDKRVAYMLSAGWEPIDVESTLNISRSAFQQAQKRIKKAARVCKHKAAQRKLHNNSIAT